MPYLVLMLDCGRSSRGEERRALVALDCQTGAPAGCERYSQSTTAEALARLMRREGWGADDVVIGPALTVPARELFRLVSAATGRARRARLLLEQGGDRERIRA